MAERRLHSPAPGTAAGGVAGGIARLAWTLSVATCNVLNARSFGRHNPMEPATYVIKPFSALYSKSAGDAVAFRRDVWDMRYAVMIYAPPSALQGRGGRASCSLMFRPTCPKYSAVAAGMTLIDTPYIQGFRPGGRREGQRLVLHLGIKHSMVLTDMKNAIGAVSQRVASDRATELITDKELPYITQRLSYDVMEVEAQDTTFYFLPRTGIMMGTPEGPPDLPRLRQRLQLQGRHGALNSTPPSATATTPRK